MKVVVLLVAGGAKRPPSLAPQAIFKKQVLAFSVSNEKHCLVALYYQCEQQCINWNKPHLPHTSAT
jgi:hypothetical protein